MYAGLTGTLLRDTKKYQKRGLQQAPQTWTHGRDAWNKGVQMWHSVGNSAVVTTEIFTFCFNEAESVNVMCISMALLKEGAYYMHSLLHLSGAATTKRRHTTNL